jgi:phenylpyruvate tautomerase
MPMINVKCSYDIPESVLKRLSSIAAETIGKPEQYVMTAGSHAYVMMSGSTEPAAFVEVKSIGGLSPEVNRALSKKICELLETELQIPAERIYITFQSFTADSWGWNSSTFG